MSKRRKCKARKKNGDRCEADAQIGKNVCVFHDPERISDGDRARRAGGIQRSRHIAVLPTCTPDLPLANASDVSTMLADCMNRVRRGELDVRVANTIGYFASIQLRCFEQGILEERLRNIENNIGLATQGPIIHAEGVQELRPDESCESHKEG